MTATKPRKLDDVPGWLTVTDRLLFEWILKFQTRTEPPGDLVELGAYQGKSAIHIGNFRQPGERYVVCDLFDDAGTEESIRPDVRHTYRTLSQESFENNYLAFHDELPVVVRGLSSVIVDHVEPDTCRLVHIDASHLYEHVRLDTANARMMLRPNGVVVFDDFRTEHTTGTAAAVWEAICRDDLHPICSSSMKLYATWGDAGPIQAELFERLSERTDHRADPHSIVDGQRIIRVAHIPPKKAPAPKTAPAPAPAPAPPPGSPAPQRLPWLQGRPREIVKSIRNRLG